MLTITCTGCKQSKPANKANFNPRSKDQRGVYGENHIYHWNKKCKSCMEKRQYDPSTFTDKREILGEFSWSFDDIKGYHPCAEYKQILKEYGPVIGVYAIVDYYGTVARTGITERDFRQRVGAYRNARKGCKFGTYLKELDAYDLFTISFWHIRNPLYMREIEREIIAEHNPFFNRDHRTGTVVELPCPVPEKKFVTYKPDLEVFDELYEYTINL